MSDFDTLLAEYTEKGNAKVHGTLMECVDKNGNELYCKIAGYDSVAPDASPLRRDAVFKMASGTKLITSIALLQCVDEGLIGLDEPLTKILPELDGQELLKESSQTGFISEPSQQKITARHLLAHTSGLAYRFLHPLLIKWSQTPEAQRNRDSYKVTERHDVPLVFEPGSGWAYGVSLDWAGVVVRRLHNGISLEEYLIENVWKRVGLSGPFPTFNISGHSEYKARLMKAAERKPDGHLQPYEFWQGDNPLDQIWPSLL